MLGVFSCDITVVANDVTMQRTQRCLGLSETRQVNRYIVIWLARARRALEASQHVIGLQHRWPLVYILRYDVKHHILFSCFTDWKKIFLTWLLNNVLLLLPYFSLVLLLFHWWWTVDRQVSQSLWSCKNLWWTQHDITRAVERKKVTCIIYVSLIIFRLQRQIRIRSRSPWSWRQVMCTCSWKTSFAFRAMLVPPGIWSTLIPRSGQSKIRLRRYALNVSRVTLDTTYLTCTQPCSTPPSCAQPCGSALCCRVVCVTRMGDPLHNLIDLHTILQHTTELSLAALWTVLSVCLSVHLSVTPFSQCSCHLVIMKLKWVIIKVMSMQRIKVRGQS